MSTGGPRRKRSDMFAGFDTPRGGARRLLANLRSPEGLSRLAMCGLAALVMWLGTRGWAPPLAYRSGHLPQRDIVARVKFSTTIADEPENERRRRRARLQTVCYYAHDTQPLGELREALRNRVSQLIQGPDFANLGPAERSTWQEFLPPGQTVPVEDQEKLFARFRAAFVDDADLAKFARGLQVAFADLERDGLLAQLGHDLEDGSQTAIHVFPIGRPDLAHRVEVVQVRIAEAANRLRTELGTGLQATGLAKEHVGELAELVNNWLSVKKLPVTLSVNAEARQLTLRAYQEAEAAIEKAYIGFEPGDRLAVTGQPLSRDTVEWLESERRAVMAAKPWYWFVRHSLAHLGMYAAMFVLCGAYLMYHHPRLIVDFQAFLTLLSLVATTVVLCKLAATDQLRAELVPLSLFGIALTIAYRRELALLLSGCVALVVTLVLGQSLAELVILLAAVFSAILITGRIRSRTRLIYVGMWASLVVFLTAFGVGTLEGQAFGWSESGQFADLPALPDWLADVARLSLGSFWLALCTLLTGLLITASLPLVEWLFDVQTDISLLELGDAAHPLLQELVRRAPGTYNHSITVASIAEAAAEAIGVNGLLVRVGAYFHDIGKMLKPGYFVENQGEGGNRHASLLPAMSTLVIIAHVKDGADLARQHHLPQSMIDFIEQHHGTTLVEFFYAQATRKCEEDPGSGAVDETSFRYPGPKPQTKEAGVLMIADASESACRSLVDPAPARIEHMVHEIIMKRLMDGQFDECNLTLRELATIEDSLVKSLTAVYHGRVKYPGQQSA